MRLELAYYSMPELKAGYYSIVHHKFSLLPSALYVHSDGRGARDAPGDGVRADSVFGGRDSAYPLELRATPRASARLELNIFARAPRLPSLVW